MFENPEKDNKLWDCSVKDLNLELLCVSQVWCVCVYALDWDYMSLFPMSTIAMAIKVSCNFAFITWVHANYITCSSST